MPVISVSIVACESWKQDLDALVMMERPICHGAFRSSSPEVLLPRDAKNDLAQLASMCGSSLDSNTVEFAQGPSRPFFTAPRIDIEGQAISISPRVVVVAPPIHGLD